MHNNNIVHLDIKPQNILLGDDYSLRLTDFGLSEPKQGEDGKGYFYKRRGTPSFMAPEILMGLPFTGVRADLFALGVVLFNLVFGS
jgi:serine/threonine protein kinase